MFVFMSMSVYCLQPIVITDLISYDTSRAYLAFNKKISYSTDTTKDVMFDIIVEKNLKWGIEVRQDFNKVNIKIGSEFTRTGTSSIVLYKAANGSMKTFSLTTSFDQSNKAAFIEVGYYAH